MRAILRAGGGWISLGAALIACSGDNRHDASLDPLSEAARDEPGTLRGHLAAQIADFDDGTTETRYFLRDAEGVSHRLMVRGIIDVAPGSPIKVWGTRRADGSIDLASYQAVFEAQSQAVDAAIPGPRTLCAGIVAVNTGTPKTTPAAAANAFHVGATSVNAFFLENSYGKVGLNGGVYGPFAYTMTGCDYTGLAAAVRPMIDAASPAKCDQYAFIMGPNVSGCGWSAYAQFGTSAAPATDTWFNDSISCVVAVQEPNHNYGAQHSSSLSCGSTPFADDLAGCTHTEYGDKYDAMGGGCYHMNGWQKLYQKWFSGCNAVSTSTSGTFYLQSFEAPCAGLQTLRVTFPGGKTRSFQSTTLTSYYLELRTASGFDAKFGAPRVLLHAGGDPPLPTQMNVQGRNTWLIDPSATGGLTAGQSFTDPAGGLTIRVQSIDSTVTTLPRATVTIEYTTGAGSPYCLDGTGAAFVPPGPEWCGTDGGTGGTGTGGTGGTGGVGGSGGTGGLCSGCSGAGGSGGSAAGGTGGTGGTVGTGGSATGGNGGVGGAVGTGGMGTGGSTGGATGGSGGVGGTAGEGGTGSGGDAARGGSGGSGGDPSDGAAGTAGSTGGTTSGAGGTTSGVGGSDPRGGGPVSDASTAGAGGTDGDFGQHRPACSCKLHARGGMSPRMAAFAALGTIALWRSRRRRRMH